MEPKDDFFEPQTPEEKLVIEQGFKEETPPQDGLPPVPPTDAPKEPTPASDVPASSADLPQAPQKVELRQPIRGADEPEWKFNLRNKIYAARKEVHDAKTPAEEAKAKKNVEYVQRELANKVKEHAQQPPSDRYKDVLSEYKDPLDLDGDRKRVEALGDGTFARKEDVPNAVQEVLRQERQVATQNKALNDFFGEYKDAYANEENRELFFDTVEQYFNYEGKDYDELRFIFDATHKTLFPENLEETIAKADTLKEKMKTVQFNGGNAALATPKDAEKEGLKKQYAAQGEDVDWFVND